MSAAISKPQPRAWPRKHCKSKFWDSYHHIICFGPYSMLFAIMQANYMYVESDYCVYYPSFCNFGSLRRRRFSEISIRPVGVASTRGRPRRRVPRCCDWRCNVLGAPGRRAQRPAEKRRAPVRERLALWVSRVALRGEVVRRLLLRQLRRLSASSTFLRP